MMYDIVGDIHGYSDALKRLLVELDYRFEDGSYRHTSRTMVFVGDFVDRGPEQREVLLIARAMVDAGAALAVMGNHEFNAVGWATPSGDGGFLRSRTPENRIQHAAFLEQVEEDADAHTDAIAWFRTLPLWLDLGGLRVVHACWHEPSQAVLREYLDGRQRLTADGWRHVYERGSAAYEALEILLKGPEAALPQGVSFLDKDGHLRRSVRLRWWDGSATTFRRAALGMEGREDKFPDEPVPGSHLYRDRIPVLFGHYWMTGGPRILQDYASCLDFSVANDGWLTAYRWSGEQRLRRENLVFVPASLKVT